MAYISHEQRFCHGGSRHTSLADFFLRCYTSICLVINEVLCFPLFFGHCKSCWPSLAMLKTVGSLQQFLDETCLYIYVCVCVCNLFIVSKNVLLFITGS